jgi:hypothetical protein
MSQYNIILRRKRGARIFERLLDKIESEMNAVNRLQPGVPSCACVPEHHIELYKVQVRSRLLSALYGHTNVD